MKVYAGAKTSATDLVKMAQEAGEEALEIADEELPRYQKPSKTQNQQIKRLTEKTFNYGQNRVDKMEIHKKKVLESRKKARDSGGRKPHLNYNA